MKKLIIIILMVFMLTSCSDWYVTSSTPYTRTYYHTDFYRPYGIFTDRIYTNHYYRQTYNGLNWKQTQTTKPNPVPRSNKSVTSPRSNKSVTSPRSNKSVTNPRNNSNNYTNQAPNSNRNRKTYPSRKNH